MDDNSFDKIVKSALDSYQDATPVSAGWGRLMLPKPAAVGWLKTGLLTSVMINVILISGFYYFYSEFNAFKNRLGYLEGMYYATDTSFVGPHRLTGIEWDLKTRPKSKRTKRTQILPGASPAIIHLPQTEEIVNRNVSASGYCYNPPNIIYQDLFTSELLPPHALSIREEMIKDEKNNVFQSNDKSNVSMKSFRELEKHRFGKGVMWGFGLASKSGFVYAPEYLSGIEYGLTPEIEMWFHPYWSIKSGVGFIGNSLISKNTNDINDHWFDYSSDPVEFLVKASNHISYLNLPLSINHHLPLTEFTSLNMGVGVSGRLKVADKVLFTQSIPEIEEEHEEDEYHKKVTDFAGSTVPNQLNFRYSIGLRKSIKKTPLFINGGLYVEHPAIHRSFKSTTMGVDFALLLRKQ